jgi:penicillin-binding protein 2
VNLYSAIAQSSNVYFYTVGGGFGDLKGLGIARLKAWWARFGLGKETGIDLPEEGKGFLPDPDWKEKTAGRPWRLGDTYNVSIGQGDLTVTPVQLIRYISAIANGGTLVTPHLYADAPLHPESLEAYKDEIAVLQEAMRTTVTAPRGTAYLLHDLSLPIAGKTGSAQVENNKAENAFFVGYAPADHPTLALLILVEHAKEGSLNAVPIARDVFAWYDEHRIQP